MSSIAFAQNDWENEQVIGINKEPVHATFFPLNSVDEAFENGTNSEWVQLLNGTWKFNWVPNVADRPTDFYEKDFDASAWNDIPVPANWQLHGFGTPIYTNITYPFDKNPPKIAGINGNPVGSYILSFTVPENWDGREIFIHFDGVSSAFCIWVNGEKAGYSQGSRTPAEFNLTKYLQKGENKLAVQVFRWCDGSYLEDQDGWRYGTSQIMKAIKIAAAIGVKHIVTAEGDPTTEFGHSLSDAEAIFSIAEKLNEPLRMAADYGVKILIEPHGKYTDSISHMEKIMDRCNSDALGVNLDTGNLWLGGGEPLEMIEKFSDKIEHVRWSFESENALLNFVKSVGGFVTFHASTTAFYEWPEFKAISTGAWIDGTYHGKQSETEVNIQNKRHPLTKGMQDFTMEDELWINAERNPLFKILGSATNKELQEKGIKKQPAIMVKDYGKGRVFHTILGHGVKNMQNEDFQNLMVRATEWAATGEVKQ